LSGFVSHPRAVTGIAKPLRNTQPFFEQLIYPALQHVVEDIISDETEELSNCFY
jgi:hypothetical protein